MICDGKINNFFFLNYNHTKNTTYNMILTLATLRILRPSSDVVLLSCRTKLHLGSTVARQENNSDSDVVPNLNQIQDIQMPRNNSPPNSPWERNLAKIH